MSKVYIVPSKLKIGFNERSSTTNGLLGYVVFFDPKTKKLRKEVSFNSWRNKDIDPVEFENTPTSGFIFSSSIARGGHYRYDSKIEKVRVYDPRGFDVEISLPNLMNIIEYYDILKTEIKGQLAYAWYNSELILIPTVADEYKKSVEVTKKFNKKFSLRDLEIGRVYEAKITNQSAEVEQKLYLGRFSVNSSMGAYSRAKLFGNYLENIGNKHIFANIIDNEIVGYEIVKPAMVVGELELLENIKTNKEIVKFQESVYTKKFEKNIYLIKLKKENILDFISIPDSPYGEDHYSHIILTDIDGTTHQVNKIFNTIDVPNESDLEISRYHYEGDKQVSKYYNGKSPEEMFGLMDMFCFSVMKAEDGHFYSVKQNRIIDQFFDKVFLLEDLTKTIDDKDFKRESFEHINIDDLKEFKTEYNKILKFMKPKKSRYLKFMKPKKSRYMFSTVYEGFISLPYEKVLKNYNIKEGL